MSANQNKFNRNDLVQLFLIVAFPLHAWTIFMALRDFEWVAESRLVSGAVGFTAYVLTFTLVESLFLFFAILLMSLLISKKWSKDRRIASLGLIALILSAWSIVEQVLLVMLFDKLITLRSLFPVLETKPWIVFVLLGILVTISFALPIFLVLRSGKLTKITLLIFERIAILSGFYLFLDAAAIVILIIRIV